MAQVTERRGAGEAEITVNEAAFAAGVTVKSVNQAIDRDQIASRLLRRATDRAKRGVEPSDAVYLAVRQVIAPDLWPELYRSFRHKVLAQIPRRLKVRSVVLDLEGTIGEVEERLNLLRKLRERVVIDPEIRAGEPVFRGTRTPVFGIARKIELGATIEELKEDHPQLADDDFELATQYARLYPRRGRPRADSRRGPSRGGSAAEP